MLNGGFIFVNNQMGKVNFVLANVLTVFKFKLSPIASFPTRDANRNPFFWIVQSDLMIF
jgi:hypothetical protein